MDLQIIYECPHCNRQRPQRLEELRPGQSKDCHACGTPVALTTESLSALRRDLHNACSH